MTGILSQGLESLNSEIATEAMQLLARLVRAPDLVGDLIKMDYSECDVLVHDHARQLVRGLPLGCFLLATRMSLAALPDPEDEDASILLLRVTGQTRLPNASEADLSRFLAGQRVATLEDVWDADGRTDQFTLHQLRYAGVLCRVLGTFRLRQRDKGVWEIVFGADVSNFYSGRGMKVYKPVGSSLASIVNFTKPLTDDRHPLAGERVPVGRLRYASSEIQVTSDEAVTVKLDPTDLVARRTALFGMSRTGKSNTTKVIAGSVFRLRARGEKLGRIGQLIFDVNGEYANENTQDGSIINQACLKNVAQHTNNSGADDVVTYGLAPHPYDPNRKIVKINFFGEDPKSWNSSDDLAAAMEPLVVGKQLIDAALATESSKYIANFRNTSLDPPKAADYSAGTRYRRVIFAYRAVLHAAGFSSPKTISQAFLKGLFHRDLVQALSSSTSADAQMYARASIILGNERSSWDEAVEVCLALRRFIADANNSGYANFNANYSQAKDGKSWHDDQLTGILSIFEYANGPRALRSLLAEHDSASAGDYARQIADDLIGGKLVIFDQSLGDPIMNKAAAERIMWAIFNRQKQSFISPGQDRDGRLLPPPDILVYAEEAHNLLPAGSASDTLNIWSRIAKEGSKYRIGLVYATQEPSSIQSNIMKNTDNWFVAHLNNSDETKELKKYYDFEDFVPSILQVADPGFIRMRTLSNPYIVPVQINRFRVV